MIRYFFVLLILAAHSAVAQTSANPVAALQSTLQDYTALTKTLTDELGFTQQKRLAAEEKLAQGRTELNAKLVQILEMRRALGSSPEENERIANESQRIALAELNIKSREAEIARLQRKESELQTALQENQDIIRTTEQSITTAQNRVQADAVASARALQQKLAALEQENEQLRIAMEEEARRARLAAAETARLAEVASQQEAERLAAATELVAPEQIAPGESRTVAGADITTSAEGDLSEVVLEGEPPIFRDDDAIKVRMRSRAIDSPVEMTPIAPNIYRAEVTLPPGRAFFDVRNRRYRGTFPELPDSEPYVFYYDLNAERPVLSVRKKSAEKALMGDLKDPF